MGPKAVETTCNINSAFGPETADKHALQWWLKKFCKEGMGQKVSSSSDLQGDKVFRGFWSSKIKK